MPSSKALNAASTPSAPGACCAVEVGFFAAGLGVLAGASASTGAFAGGFARLVFVVRGRAGVVEEFVF